MIRSTAFNDFGGFRDDDVVGGGFVERVGHGTYLNNDQIENRAAGILLLNCRKKDCVCSSTFLLWLLVASCFVGSINCTYQVPGTFSKDVLLLYSRSTTATSLSTNKKRRHWRITIFGGRGGPFLLFTVRKSTSSEDKTRTKKKPSQWSVAFVRGTTHFT